MPRRLPPLNALKAFEAAARHESFTRAAEELYVTQGAVSHQVKALETELGLKLFNRERQRLVITEAGRDYLAIVRDAFDRIADGTERLLQRQRGGALTVSTSPNFAAKWLVHRLGRFAEVHPEIDLRVSASANHVDFAREDIDLAIRHGDGNAPGLNVTRLCAEELFPVCSPKLFGGRNPLRKPATSAASRSCTSMTGRTGAVARLCRRHRRRSRARPRSQPGEHGHRCGGQRPGCRARPHRACGLGSDRRPAGAAVRDGDAGCATPIGSSAQRLPRGYRKSLPSAIGFWLRRRKISGNSKGLASKPGRAGRPQPAR